MDDPTWLEVKDLTTYEIAPDGTSVRLRMIDSTGREANVIVPMDSLQQLTLTMPKMVAQLLQAACRDPALRLVHNVATWKIERGDDGQSIVTFETPDNFQASFALPSRDLANMAMTAARQETDLQPPSAP